MKKILFLSATVLMLASCDLDINENPNYPSSTDITPELMFPAVENSIADCIGDQMFNYAGFFAQYFEQAPTANQYNTLAELNINEGSDLFNRCYSALYAGALQDIKDIMSKTDNPANLFALTVMRAQAFQVLVDNLDKVPYTEALQGSENAMPAWDEGKVVYEGVLAEMDEAEAALGSEAITMTDPLLNKSVSQWRGYANALRLRMYMRLIDAGVNAGDYQNKAKALVSANNFFAGDVAWNVYTNASGQYSPWYGAYYRLGTINHCATYPIVSYMQATEDPRLGAYIGTAARSGEYYGQIPGCKTLMGPWSGGEAADWKNEDVSCINYPTVADAPIYLFTQAELQFLIAEVQLRFNNNAAAAKAAYEAAVAADFASRGVDGASTFLAGNRVKFDAQSSSAAQLKLIYMQKWTAFFMRNHMEGWSEARRTDVPSVSSRTAKQVFDDATTYTAGDFIVPGVNNIVAGGLAKRVPYPSNARTLNRNTPEAKLLSDRVFWDAK